MTSTATEIVAVYRWFSWGQVLLALAGVVIAVLALRIFPLAVGGLIALVFIAASAYIMAVALVNRTTVRATREVLEARHGPLPAVFADAMDAFGFWPDVKNVWIPSASLLAIATGERAVMDLSKDRDRSPTKVYLRAVYHDGAGQTEIQLLPSMASGAVETYIGWQLGRWLQDADLPYYKGVDLSPD